MGTPGKIVLMGNTSFPVLVNFQHNIVMAAGHAWAGRVVAFNAEGT